jgi:O-antigen ligase
MQARLSELKVFRLAGLFTLAAGVILFAITGAWLSLLAPLGICYLWILYTNWKLAYWLLLASVPVSVHVSSLLGSLSTSLPDEPMTWGFFLLLPLLLLYRPSLIPAKALLSPIALIVGLQLFWVAVSTAYSTDVLLSLKYFLVRLWLMIVFFVFPFIVFRDRTDFSLAFRLVLLPVVATIVAVLIRHAMLGFGFRLINDAIGLMYYNHVEYSTILSMIFPLACMAWPLLKEKPSPIRIAMAFILSLFAVAILLSYARAAILAVAFAGVIAFSIRHRFSQLIMLLFYAVVIGLMSYFIHENRYLAYRPDYEQTIMHDDVGTHLEATFEGTDMSGMERVYRWIAAVRMSTEKPITGYGPNSFVQQYKSYTVPAFRTFVSANTEQSTTHNYFLYLLAEQGWPGMLLYALLTLIVIREAQGTYHRFTDRFYKCCTLGLAMMFAAAFVNNCFSELTDTHKVGALFLLSISLIAVLSYKSRQLAVQEKIPL